MIDATGQPQSLLVLGGASEIAQAVTDRLVAGGRCRTVVLAGRPSPRLAEAARRAEQRGATSVHPVEFDAADVPHHREVVDSIFDRYGDLDVVLVAAGQLGDQESLEHDPDGTAALLTVNFVGLAAALVAVADRMRRQGHGRIVVLSSVAGDRPRRANFVYGSSKAGLDAFAQGLGDALQGSGVGVTVVRPGFVVGRMTTGMKPAPLASTPDQVGLAVAAALRRHDQTVWVPRTLPLLATALRLIPRPLWRQLRR